MTGISIKSAVAPTPSKMPVILEVFRSRHGGLAAAVLLSGVCARRGALSKATGLERGVAGPGGGGPVLRVHRH